MDLKKYVLDVEKLEKEKYALECTIRKIDSQIAVLGSPITVRRARNPIPEEDTQFSFLQVIIILCAIGWGAFGIHFISVAPAKLVFLLILAYLLPAGLAIYFVVKHVQRNRSHYDENEERIAQMYRADQQRAQRQIEQEKQMAVYYKDARNALYNTYTKTCNLLKRMYSCDIIYDKYRYDLVAICMFAEYFKSRRCTSFEGHEGAYNLFENEIRLGIIISKLDEIIDRLDRIEQNQYGLYRALKEISSKQDRIITNLETISKKQDQQIENAEYMRYNLEILRTNSDIAMIYGMSY